MFMIGLAATLWGLDGVVLTPRLSNINVVLVVFLLHGLPFLVMNSFLFKRYKDLKKLDKKALYSLIFVSVFGGAIGTISIVYALFIVNFQELSVVVLLQKFQPVFAILLASLFLGERLSKAFIKWSIVAIFAGYFLTFGWNLPNLHTDVTTLKAAMLSLLASFSFGSSTVFGKRLLEKIDFLSATFFRYGLTFLLLLPIVIALGKYTDIQDITSTNWMIFGIIALTSGSVTIVIYYYGLQHIKASNATLLELFFPISAILFDYFINKNSLTPIQWISAAVMIFAIIRAGLNTKLKEK
jgi:drug/metabolite transporter (DMT)-like permease